MRTLPTLFHAFFLFCASHHSALAICGQLYAGDSGSGKETHGGSYDEMKAIEEFRIMTQSVVRLLEKDGAQYFPQIPLYDFKMMAERVINEKDLLTSIEYVYVNGVPKDACNEFPSIHITVSWHNWQEAKNDFARRAFAVIHEISGLLDPDGDGQSIEIDSYEIVSKQFDKYLGEKRLGTEQFKQDLSYYWNSFRNEISVAGIDWISIGALYIDFPNTPEFKKCVDRVQMYIDGMEDLPDDDPLLALAYSMGALQGTESSCLDLTDKMEIAPQHSPEGFYRAQLDKERNHEIQQFSELHEIVNQRRNLIREVNNQFVSDYNDLLPVFLEGVGPILDEMEMQAKCSSKKTIRGRLKCKLIADGNAMRSKKFIKHTENMDKLFQEKTKSIYKLIDGYEE